MPTRAPISCQVAPQPASGFVAFQLYRLVDTSISCHRLHSCQEMASTVRMRTVPRGHAAPAASDSIEDLLIHLRACATNDDPLAIAVLKKVHPDIVTADVFAAAQPLLGHAPIGHRNVAKHPYVD